MFYFANHIVSTKQGYDEKFREQIEADLKNTILIKKECITYSSSKKDSLTYFCHTKTSQSQICLQWTPGTPDESVCYKQVSTIQSFLGSFHGKQIQQILCVLDNSAIISSRQNYYETLNSQNSGNIIRQKYFKSLPSRKLNSLKYKIPRLQRSWIYSVQLSVMNR